MYQMIALDPIDVSILKELLKDGRQSFASIARINGVSADVISNHYVEMEKAGIIVGATIQLNYLLFGYQGVTLIFIRSDLRYHQKILDDLRKIPNISTSACYNSPFDISVITMFKGLNELDMVKQLIKNRYPIHSSRAYIWTDVRNFPENLQLQSIDNSVHDDVITGEIKPKNECPKLDDLDHKIVEELTRNGRAPFNQIAKVVDSSTDTVKRRYERLVENNFMKVSIQINPALLGYKATVHFLISMSNQSELNKIVELLTKIPNVSYIVKMSGGDFELLVCMLVMELDEICVVTDKIREIPDVERVESYIKKVPLRWPTPRQYISSF